MKNYLLPLLVMITSFVYGQSTSIPQHGNRSSAYFVDSVRVSSEVMNYIKPADIKDVYVSQKFVDKVNNIYGAIYITTVDAKAYNFISLKEIQKNQGINITGPAIYMIDHQFIKDTKHFKLPASFIHNIIITKGTEFDNLKNELPNFSIVNIITKENAPKSKGLMIRGTAEK